MMTSAADLPLYSGWLSTGMPRPLSVDPAAAVGEQRDVDAGGSSPPSPRRPSCRRPRRRGGGGPSDRWSRCTCPGRSRTGSRPLRTVMSLASYATRVRLSISGLGERRLRRAPERSVRAGRSGPDARPRCRRVPVAGPSRGSSDPAEVPGQDAGIDPAQCTRTRAPRRSTRRPRIAPGDDRTPERRARHDLPLEVAQLGRPRSASSTSTASTPSRSERGRACVGDAGTDHLGPALATAERRRRRRRSPSSALDLGERRRATVTRLVAHVSGRSRVVLDAAGVRRAARRSAAMPARHRAARSSPTSAPAAGARPARRRVRRRAR